MEKINKIFSELDELGISKEKFTFLGVGNGSLHLEKNSEYKCFYLDEKEVKRFISHHTSLEEAKMYIVDLERVLSFKKVIFKNIYDRNIFLYEKKELLTLIKDEFKLNKNIKELGELYELVQGSKLPDSYEEFQMISDFLVQKGNLIASQQTVDKLLLFSIPRLT